MADAGGPPSALRRRSPAGGFAARFAAAGRDDTVRLAERPFLAMVDLRVAPVPLPGRDHPDPGRDHAETYARVEEALGLAVPQTPCTASGDADRGVLWMGPDWWLVVGPPDTEGKTAARLRTALGAAPGGVVDVSAQRTALDLAGPHARDVLMTGCRIDLHPRAFPAGTCVQTLLARAQVVLQNLGPDGASAPAFRVLVRASFAAYLAAWLLDAMAEHT